MVLHLLSMLPHCKTLYQICTLSMKPTSKNLTFSCSSMRVEKKKMNYTLDAIPDCLWNIRWPSLGTIPPSISLVVAEAEVCAQETFLYFLPRIHGSCFSDKVSFHVARNPDVTESMSGVQRSASCKCSGRVQGSVMLVR